MSKLTLHGDALERAADRLGIAIPAPEETKPPPITPREARKLRRAAVVAFHKRIASDCPAAFAPPNHAPVAALAIGIDAAIADRYRDVPARTRHLFIREYTHQVAYLHRLTIAGGVRVGLDGAPSGEVTEEQAKNAAERLAQLAAGNKSQDGGSP
jgi:sRNA-binding protein